MVLRKGQSKLMTVNTILDLQLYWYSTSNQRSLRSDLTGMKYATEQLC